MRYANILSVLCQTNGLVLSSLLSSIVIEASPVHTHWHDRAINTNITSIYSIYSGVQVLLWLTLPKEQSRIF